MKLPDLPSGWNWKRLKYVADLQTGITLGKDYGSRDTTLRPYLRVANVQDGYLDLETITEIAVPESEASRCELRDGDVLMTEGGDFDKLGRGYVWTGQIQGCLHQNHVFAVRPLKGMLNSRFLSAVMTSHHGKAYFTSTSQQTTNLACTNSTKIREFPIPLPSFNTQNWIPSQLDRQTAKIDALTQRKERLIALLEEKRAALINRAVTKGLDPSAPMKDSGIPWLGCVSAHWSVAPIGRRYSVQLGKMLDEKRITGKHLVPYLRNVDVQWDRINTDDLPEMDFPPEDRNRYRLISGDLLVCEGGEVGRAAIWQSPVPECCYQKALHRLRPLNEGDRPRFLYYCLRAAATAGLFIAESNPNTIDHLTADKLKQHRFPFPPSAEQGKIVAELDERTAQIAAAIAKIREQITKFQEYRTALISAAVTGKIDVREAAGV